MIPGVREAASYVPQLLHVIAAICRHEIPAFSDVFEADLYRRLQLPRKRPFVFSSSVRNPHHMKSYAEAREVPSTQAAVETEQPTVLLLSSANKRTSPRVLRRSALSPAPFVPRVSNDCNFV
jgi:hypothetical protein